MSADIGSPDPTRPEILSIYPIYVCQSCGCETPVPPASAALQYCPRCFGSWFKIR